MSVAKKLLVNADDFGLSSAINAGIVHSHTHGIVSSTSLVASGEAFDEAVLMARANASLGVGVHLTLVEERPVASASEIPTLAPDGLLPATYGELMKGVVTGRIRLRDIEREFRAQIDKCLAAGLKLTHLDSHQHTHALPSLFPIVVRLANEFGIRGIRIPRSWPGLRDVSADRFAAKCILCLFAHSDGAFFKRGACLATDRFAGLFESGALSEQSLLDILDSLRVGTTELVCHPGCADSTPRYAKWNLRRQTEMASLTSARVKEMVNSLGIELISYCHL